MEAKTRSKRKTTLTKKILFRDTKMCQCCGCIPTAPEVHHIESVCFGGESTENNLITLCPECHKHAPLNPDEFLAYQRMGGAKLARALGEQILMLAATSPQTTVAEVLEKVTEARIFWFDYNRRLLTEKCED
jgi:HNH endonuclease